jgi:hypothetical protein
MNHPIYRDLIDVSYANFVKKNGLKSTIKYNSCIKHSRKSQSKSKKTNCAVISALDALFYAFKYLLGAEPSVPI